MPLKEKTINWFNYYFDAMAQPAHGNTYPKCA